MKSKVTEKVTETVTVWKARIDRLYHLFLAGALAIVCGNAIYDYLQGRDGHDVWGYTVLVSGVLVTFLAKDVLVKHLDGKE